MGECREVFLPLSKHMSFPGRNEDDQVNADNIQKSASLAFFSRRNADKLGKYLRRARVTLVRYVLFCFFFIVCLFTSIYAVVLMNRSFIQVYEEMFDVNVETINNYILNAIIFSMNGSGALLNVLNSRIAVNGYYERQEEIEMARNLTNAFFIAYSVTSISIPNWTLEICGNKRIYSSVFNVSDVSSSILFYRNESSKFRLWVGIDEQGINSSYPYELGTEIDYKIDYESCSDRSSACNAEREDNPRYSLGFLHESDQLYPVVKANFQIPFTEDCIGFYHTGAVLNFSDLLYMGISDQYSRMGLFDSSGQVVAVTGSDTGSGYINNRVYIKNVFQLSDPVWKAISSDEKFLTGENFSIEVTLDGKTIKYSIYKFVFDISSVDSVVLYSLVSRASLSEYEEQSTLAITISMIIIVQFSMLILFGIYMLLIRYCRGLQKNADDYDHDSYESGVIHDETSVFSLISDLEVLLNSFPMTDKFVRRDIEDVIFSLITDSKTVHTNINCLLGDEIDLSVRNALIRKFSNPYATCCFNILVLNSGIYAPRIKSSIFNNTESFLLSEFESLETVSIFRTKDLYLFILGTFRQFSSSEKRLYCYSLYFIKMFCDSKYHIPSNIKFSILYLNLVWHVSVFQKRRYPNSFFENVFLTHEAQYINTYEAFKYYLYSFLRMSSKNKENTGTTNSGNKASYTLVQEKWELISYIFDRLRSVFTLNNHMNIICNQFSGFFVLKSDEYMGALDPLNLGSLILIGSQVSYFLKGNKRLIIERLICQIDEIELKHIDEIYIKRLVRSLKVLYSHVVDEFLGTSTSRL